MSKSDLKLDNVTQRFVNPWEGVPPAALKEDPLKTVSRSSHTDWYKSSIKKCDPLNEIYASQEVAKRLEAENDAKDKKNQKKLKESGSIVTWFQDLIQNIIGKGKTETIEEEEKEEDSKSEESPIGNRPKLPPPDENAQNWIDEAKKANKQTNETDEEFDTKGDVEKKKIIQLQELLEALRSKDPLTGDTLALKLMMIALNAQNQIRETNGALSTEKIIQQQKEIKIIRQERVKLKEENAEQVKRLNFFSKIKPFFQGGAFLGFMVTGAITVTCAAGIASGGVLLVPAAIVTGVLTGVAGLGQAATSGLGGYTKFQMNKLQAELVDNQGKSDIVEFKMTISLKEMEEAMKQVAQNSEISASILRAWAEAISASNAK